MSAYDESKRRQRRRGKVAPPAEAPPPEPISRVATGADHSRGLSASRAPVPALEGGDGVEAGPARPPTPVGSSILRSPIPSLSPPTALAESNPTSRRAYYTSTLVHDSQVRLPAEPAHEGGEWLLMSPMGTRELVWVATSEFGGARAHLTISDTPPPNPAPADQWFDTKTARTLVWYHDGDTGQWVTDALDSSGSGGGGGDFPDAPADGQLYGRENEAWKPVPIQADAPSDGSEYVRQDGAWVVNSGGGGGVPEAPIDDTHYARKNGTWQGIDAVYAPIVHNHDGDYAPLIHNHDGVYSPVGHSHDDRYFTEAESDARFAPIVHNHDGDYSPLGHTHDDRYFTEAEADARFAPISHNHVLADITDAGTMAGINDAPSDGSQYARKDGVWEVVSAGAGTFTGLTDTPGSYAGNAGKLVKVDPTGAFLIFGDPSGTTVSWGDIQGTLANQTDLQNALDGKAAVSHDHNGVYEPVFSKNTAFNKNFGGNGIADSVSHSDHNHDAAYAPAGHNHDGVYEPVFAKNTGFNLNLGTTVGTVAEGNHSHDANYSPIGHNHDADYVNVTGDLMAGALGMDAGNYLYFNDDIPELVGAIRGVQASGLKELQIIADDQPPGPGLQASYYLRMYASGITLDAPQIAAGFINPTVNDRVVVGGLTSSGKAILSLEPAPPPPYEETGTGTTDVQIHTGIGNSGWVQTGVTVTLAQDLTALQYNVAVQAHLRELGGRTGRYAFGLRVNAVNPALPSASDLQEVPPNMDDVIAGTTPATASLTSGDVLELVIYGEGDHAQFDLDLVGTITTTVLHVYELGGGAPAISIHNDLTGRDAADAHPIGAVTGLQAALDGKVTDAPSDGTRYGRLNGAWNDLDAAFAAIGHNHDGVYSPAAHNHDGVYSPVGHTHLLADITDSGSMAAVNDAPSDGNEYVRKDGAWAIATGGGGASVTVSATPPGTPNEGDLWFDSKTGHISAWYNDGNSSQWVTDALSPESGGGGGGGLSDAPSDGTRYGRLNGAWNDLDAAYAVASHNHDGTYEPANANIQAHISSTTNPHGVTAAQVGASPTGHQHTLADITDSGGMAAVNDATSDGSLYGRRNGAWANIVAGDIPDLSATYALASHNHDGTYEPANANIQAHIANVSNPHGVDQTDVGLANVLNVPQVESVGGSYKIEVVAALPGTPDGNTLYFVTA